MAKPLYPPTRGQTSLTPERERQLVVMMTEQLTPLGAVAAVAIAAKVLAALTKRVELPRGAAAAAFHTAWDTEPAAGPPIPSLAASAASAPTSERKRLRR